jgi:predicted SprT family Zn-dependent metalloprotease
MMESIAVEITESLIDLFKLDDWFVSVRNFFPELDEEYGERSKTLGCCDYDTKSIRLLRKHVTEESDADVLETITHEVAHAMIGEGCGHGNAFKLTHEAVHQRAMKHIVTKFGK